jgi:hypothetical protein
MMIMVIMIARVKVLMDDQGCFQGFPSPMFTKEMATGRNRILLCSSQRFLIKYYEVFHLLVQVSQVFCNTCLVVFRHFILRMVDVPVNICICQNIL